MQSTLRPTLHGLTSLRFFLAMMVLVGHHAGRDMALYGPAALVINGLGPFAVSWFFVLSGFVIAYNYPALPTVRSKLEFLALRVARLWPVHVAVILISAGLFHSAYGTVIHKPYYLVTSLLMVHSWWPIDAMTSAFNGPAWSISDEWFFYIAFVGLLSSTWSVRLAAFFVPVFIGLAVAYSYGCWSPAGENVEWPNGFSCSLTRHSFPPLRLMEFVAGIALLRVWLRYRGVLENLRPAAVLVLHLSCCAVFVLALYWLHNGPFPTTSPLVHFGLSRIALIAAGIALIVPLATNRGLGWWLSSAWLVFAGEISYSIYMTHVAVTEKTIGMIKEWPLVAQLAWISALTIAVSAVMFLVVERPVRDGVKRWLRSRTARHVQGRRYRGENLASGPLRVARAIHVRK